jgi:hypothetical protein
MNFARRDRFPKSMVANQDSDSTYLRRKEKKQKKTQASAIKRIPPPPSPRRAFYPNRK